MHPSLERTALQAFLRIDVCQDSNKNSAEGAFTKGMGFNPFLTDVFATPAESRLNHPHVFAIGFVFKYSHNTISDSVILERSLAAFENTFGVAPSCIPEIFNGSFFMIYNNLIVGGSPPLAELRESVSNYKLNTCQRDIIYYDVIENFLVFAAPIFFLKIVSHDLIQLFCEHALPPFTELGTRRAHGLEISPCTPPDRLKGVDFAQKVVGG